MAGVLCLALGVRLTGAVLLTGYGAPWPLEYEVIARSILENGFFGFNFEGLPLMPSSFMPPAYPFFLAGVMALSPGESDTAIKLVQSLLSTISVLVTFCLARELLRHDVAALLSALFAALYPSFIAGSLEISTVTPEVLLVQLFALFLIRWHHTGARRHAVWAGAALGLLSLTRAPALLIVLFASVWMIRSTRGEVDRERVRDLAVFLAAVGLVVAPWTIRNYVVHRAVIPVSTNGGINLWIGNNPQATGEFVYFKEVAPDLFARSLPLTEVQRDSMFYGEALAYIRENPQLFFKMLVTKTLYFWWFRPSMGSSYPEAGQVRDIARTGMVVGYSVIAPLALVGLFLLRKNRSVIFVFGTVAVPYMATSVIFFAATRFRSPIEPVLTILAAHTATRVAGRFAWLQPHFHQNVALRPYRAKE